MAEITNPSPSGTFEDIFGKSTALLGNLGGQYLTIKGQEAIAKAQLDAQARLTGYSLVNPSLGAVDPAAALRNSGKSPVQEWLPGGLPLVGTNATVAQSGAASMGNPLVKWGILAVGLLVLVWLVKKVVGK